MQPAPQIETSTHHKNAPSPRDYSRDELLVLATRRFVGVDTVDRLTLDQFKEAFHSLIGQVSSNAKREISSLLSETVFTPRDVMFYLACEPFHIAEAILTRSMVPNQLDLLRIVEKTPIEHARAVATRPDLGAALVQHLLRMNDGKIADYLKANGALLVKSKPAEVAVKPEGGAQANSSKAGNITYSISRQKGVKPSSDAAEAKTPKAALLAAAARGNRFPSAHDASKSLLKSNAPKVPIKHNFQSGIEQAALKGSRPAMAALMQKKFNLTLDTCHQLFEDKSGDTLAVLLKAADVDAGTANRVTLLTFPSIGLSVKNARRAVKFYDHLNSDSCRAALDKWPKLGSTLPKSHSPVLTQDDPRIQRETHTHKIAGNSSMTDKVFGLTG